MHKTKTALPSSTPIGDTTNKSHAPVGRLCWCTVTSSNVWVETNTFNMERNITCRIALISNIHWVGQEKKQWGGRCWSNMKTWWGLDVSGGTFKWKWTKVGSWVPWWPCRGVWSSLVPFDKEILEMPVAARDTYLHRLHSGFAWAGGRRVCLPFFLLLYNDVFQCWSKNPSPVS